MVGGGEGRLAISRAGGVPSTQSECTGQQACPIVLVAGSPRAVAGLRLLHTGVPRQPAGPAFFILGEVGRRQLPKPPPSTHG